MNFSLIKEINIIYNVNKLIIFNQKNKIYL